MNIVKPTLLLDKQKCLDNITFMAKKAEASNVIFRPHFKTHQSIEIGNWFRKFDVKAIAVSSLDMALYFARAGWKDITVAFPVNILEIKKINYLIEHVTLNLLVENIGSITFLSNHMEGEAGVFVKIDAGYHRTGIDYRDMQQIFNVIDYIGNAKNLIFKGLLIHSGDSYQARGASQVLQIYNKTLDAIAQLKNYFCNQYPGMIISIGDTPSCSVAGTFQNIDEIRPGNFVFYDAMQLHIGSCSAEQIAVAIACPVVAKHEKRNEIVIYGGAVHFSKDYILSANGKKSFGFLVALNRYGWGPVLEGNYLANLSQEHGIVKVTNKIFKSINVGDLLGILPIHSCLTVNEMKHYYCFDGDIGKANIYSIMGD